MKRKSSPLKKAKDKCWSAFSLYIRLKYSDWRGNCTCVSCGKTQHYKKQQGGHFVQGRHNSVLFDERNVHPQCYGCNICKSGNLYEYGKFMEKTYGQEVIDELFELNKQTVKFSVQDYEKMTKDFKKKTKQLNQNNEIFR